MKTLRYLLFTLSLALVACNCSACSSGNVEPVGEFPGTGSSNTDDVKLKLAANGTTFTATLADNSSAAALVQLLKHGNITLQMIDYAGMEKVGSLGATLPRNDERITTSAGDHILYLGNSFVIYYGPNTYPLIRLGKIKGATREDLLAWLGTGEVTVSLSLE